MAAAAAVDVPRSQVNPKESLTAEHWLLTDVTLGVYPGHTVLVFEGLDESGRAWLWACDFMPMDHRVFNGMKTSVAFSAHLTVKESLPGLIRTTDPVPENAGLARGLALLSRGEFITEPLSSCRSYKVAPSEARKAQLLINVEEKNPPVYFIFGEGIAREEGQYNCATWARAQLRACVDKPSDVGSKIVPAKRYDKPCVML